MAKKILIIEDSPITIELVSLRLKNCGYEVFSALGGKKGLDLMHSLKPDLVILDVMMPELDGFAVCRLAKADFSIKDIPILFFTASSQELDIKKGKEAGGDGYIIKPYEGNDLITAVEKVFKKG